MSNIGGKKKEQAQEQREYAKKVGLFEANVIAVNPNAEEYNDILGIELKEDSKAVEYLGKSQDGNTTLRVDFWLEEIKNKDKFKVTFFLENKEKENKDATKKQYINEVGVCSWAADANDLPEWFAKRDYRVSFVGEEELYNFMRTWLGGLDYSDETTQLMLEWKEVMKGNLTEWKEEIGGENEQTVGALATVKTVDRGEGPKSYQSVFSKSFFPGYSIKNMRLVDYNNPDVVRGLTFRKSAELKMHERFVVNVAGEYGCKEFYTFKDLQDYDPDTNLVESDKVLAIDDSDF
jgi:hypothetical protein